MLNKNLIEQTLFDHGYTAPVPIGEGGTSTVFLVHSTKYDEDFVVKIISTTNRESKKMAEINSLMKLSHPNIINLYEFFYDNEYLYIILEYCPGGSLMDIINNSGSISGPRLYQYCRDIIDGLRHCHQFKVAHLDIKPQNILIDRYGRLKLADFGLSLRFNHHTNQNQNQKNTSSSASAGSSAGSNHNHSESGENYSDQFAGSKVFMAPELLQKKHFDPFAADIWSLGITFYLMATGTSPWGDATALELVKAISVGVYSYPRDLDPDFIRILKSMIDLSPSKRVSIETLANDKLFDQVPISLNKLRRNTDSFCASIRALPSVSAINLLNSNNSMNSFNSINSLNSVDDSDQTLQNLSSSFINGLGGMSAQQQQQQQQSLINTGYGNSLPQEGSLMMVRSVDERSLRKNSLTTSSAMRSSFQDSRKLSSSFFIKRSTSRSSAKKLVLQTSTFMND